jgi:hypothetical protein
MLRPVLGTAPLPSYACSNGSDDDEDGSVDFPTDTGCSGTTDIDERGTIDCDDAADDDLDTLFDYPSDPGCTAIGDTSELNAAIDCDDGVDDDGDTFTDYPDDPGCTSPTDTSELGTAQCDDGIDNDGVGGTDFPDDVDCENPTGVSEGSPGIVNAVFIATPVQGSSYCLPPCVVHLDAGASTATTTTRPFHELAYSFDCGEPDGGSYRFGSQPNDRRLVNEPKGPISGCVYRTPGIKTIKMRATNRIGGSDDAATTTVTVTDPITALGAANVWCLRNGGAATYYGCPLDADRDGACELDPGGHCTTTTNFTTALSTASADLAAKAIYFRAGDTFAVGSVFGLYNGLTTTAGVIGSFGTGAKPILTGSTNGLVTPRSHWTIAGFYTQPANGPVFGQIPHSPVVTNNFTIYGVKALNPQSCLTSTTNGGLTISDLGAVVDFECDVNPSAGDASGSHMFVRFDRFLMLGSEVDSHLQGEFNFRTVAMSHSAIQHSDFRNPGQAAPFGGGAGQRNPMQIRAWSTPGPSGTPPPKPDLFNVISDNKFVWHGGTGAGLAARMAIRTCEANDCPSDQSDAVTPVATPQEVADMVIERNLLVLNGVGIAQYIGAIWEGKGGRITIRDNIVDTQGIAANPTHALNFANQEAHYTNCSSCADDDIETYGNTWYYAENTAGVDFDMCVTQPGTTGHICALNLVYKPGDTGAGHTDQAGTIGTYTVNSNNKFATVNPFVALPPGFGLTDADDFTLNTVTGASDGGKDITTTPGFNLNKDFTGLCRPDSTSYDAGAFERGAVVCADTPRDSLTGLNLEKLGAENNKYGWILFADVMNTAKRQEATAFLQTLWDARDATTFATQSGYTVLTDANGYPTETYPFDPAGAVGPVVARAEVLYSNPWAPHGIYTATFTGTGSPQVRFSGDATTVICTSSPCSVRVDPTGGTAGVTVDIIQGNVTALSLLVPEEYRLDQWYRPTIDQLRGVDVVRNMNSIWVNGYPCSDGATAATSAACTHTWAARQPAAALQSGRKGLAWEHFFALCNEIDADCWAAIPHAAEASYGTNLGTLATSNLESGNRLWVDLSNESAWGGFDSQDYFLATATARGYTGTSAEKTQKAYVAKLAEFVAPIKATYPGAYIILNSQAANTTVTTNELTYWGDGTTPTAFNTTAENLDAVSIAPYFGFSTWDFYDACVGGGCPTEAALIAQAIFDLPAYVTTKISDQEAIITAAGLDMVAYEGGTLISHVAGSSSVANATLRAIVDRAVFLPAAEDMIDDYYDIWDAEGGLTFVHFGWVHPESVSGQMLIPDATDAPRTPMWRALQERIRSKRTE